MQQLEYSIVLPAYLEEENLRILLPRIHAELKKLGRAYEIVVVDTMTPLDATEQVCRETGTVYVNRKNGNSFGDAVRTGIETAQGNWILFMDADGSHTPEFIPEMIRETGNHDLVIASRYIEGGYTENDRTLKLMSKILNWSYAFILNLKLKDVSNSFKIYRASFLKSLKLKCDNFDIVEEILYKVVRLNPSIKVKEIPFSFKKRMFGETKRNLFVFILTYIFTILRLRLMPLK